MPDLEAQLQTALEPLVLKVEAMVDELARLKADRLEAAALEPLAHDLEAVRAELARLKVPGLDAPAWSIGDVHRKGDVVQHFHGQYFEATVDTAAEPGDGVAWRRLGLHGFRYRGLYIDGAEYEIGDLVARDGSMLLQTAGQLTWLAIRGKQGRRGEPGKGGA